MTTFLIAIRYIYDFQGRPDRREVRHDTLSAPNNILHFVDYDYDSLGRISTETNGLGAFNYTYNADNHTGKVDAISYPNGVTASFDYYPVAGTANDTHLRDIHYTDADTTTLSKFTYAYDPVGSILEWQQQQGSTVADGQTYTFSYTRKNELKDAILRNNTGGLIEERSWQYDLVGNRLRQSLGSSSTYWHHNELNQIDRQGGAGTTLVEGTLNEPAIVEVSVNSGDYERATVLSNPGSGDFLFRREVEVNQGLNTIDVYATDASGNTSPIKNYELTLPAETKTYEYDLNGNLLYELDSSGNVLREFRWDAKNRLTYISEGLNETEFEYDGQDRRRRIVERVNGIEQSNETYLWVGGSIFQKRNPTGENVLQDYYWFGFAEGANSYFYTRDHLGSVLEVVNSDGSTIESRYAYDLWGNVARIFGTGVESDFLYTGHFYHAASELHLAQYRAYDSELGRWLSRDPIAENGGINLYAYVLNDPVNRYDPNVLSTIKFGAAFGFGGYVEYSTDNGGSSIKGGAGIGFGFLLEYTPTPEPLADWSSDECNDYEQVGDSISIGVEVSGAAKLGPLASAGGNLAVDSSTDKNNNYAVTGKAGGNLGVGYGKAGASFGGSVEGGIRGNGLNGSEAFGKVSVGNSYGVGLWFFAGFNGSYTFR